MKKMNSLTPFFIAALFFHSSLLHSLSKSNLSIATVDTIATNAGVQAFRDGGNAFDAAVAAGLVLGVVNGYNSGIGGGCFIVGRDSKNKEFTINGRETAPAKAHKNLFVINGKAQSQLSKEGALAIAVPGALLAYSELSKKYGRLPFRTHLINAAKIAKNGFQISESYAERIKANETLLRKHKSSARIFLDQKGHALKAGTLLRQEDLSETYLQIAKNGTDWFYKGAFAEKTHEWMADNGGILTKEDLNNYHTTNPDPIVTQFKDFTLIGMPPPSSGGIHVAQILNILENFNLQKIKPQSPEYYHIISEAMKLAFADRAHWLGDPAFTNVPKGLISKEYAKFLAKKIDLSKTIKVKSHSTPPGADKDFFNKHTTHFSCSDGNGNWVSITSTINTSFGSKVIIPGTGVLMNNEMDDFSIQPGTPNAFGLIGNESNKIEGGKRPLSSMSPTIVLKNNTPVLATGAAGGPTIISQTVLTILNTLVYGMPISEAIAKPRFHHQWKPDVLRIEKNAGPKILSFLREKGHDLRIYENFGSTQSISNIKGQADAAHDKRTGGESVVLP